MMFTARKKDYVEGEGAIRYLDGSSLARPINMPRPQLAVMGVFVIAAAIIGGVFLTNVLDNVLHAAERAQASVEQNLARPASYENLPPMAMLMTLDDETIKQNLTDAGYTIYDMTSAEEYPAGGFEVIKLPDDVSIEQAALLYAQGIPSLSAPDAALVLNGSWRMAMDRTSGANLSVKYADFKSGSVEAAVQAALAAEGLDATVLGESGVDEAGNTFQAGTVDAEDTTYSWKVSAIPLTSMYDISGLPDTAVYVGIRMTSE